ncbi:hypothetical protein ACWDLG_19935 [Nonomuraea sp. NPDC003727]
MDGWGEQSSRGGSNGQDLGGGAGLLLSGCLGCGYGEREAGEREAGEREAGDRATNAVPLMPGMPYSRGGGGTDGPGSEKARRHADSGHAHAGIAVDGERIVLAPATGRGS